MTRALLACSLAVSTAFCQTALIDDAWWTHQQDCNGDNCQAGTLSGDRARLNWAPHVSNCNGTLTVFEKVYVKACASGTWTAVFTNAPHTITGCRSLNQRYIDLPMAAGCGCRDYKIEVYRVGQTIPDSIRSSTNDVDLAQHSEQLLAQDFCASDVFATCASLDGTQGSASDNNSFATKQPGEPAHAGNAGGRSLWYCWIAPTNQPVTFDTTGSSFDTLLAIYTGSSVSNLSLVIANDDIAGASNRQSRVTFTPATGVTYRIAVDGFGGASGNLVVNWNQTGSALPDLIIWGPATSPEVINRSFAAGDCEVLEGCATPGLQRLLSFSTETRNIGAGDLLMGNPATNSVFHFASCHGHFHFEEFAQYDLLDTNGNVIASGHKVGFCLLDVIQWSPTANPQPKYDCNNQGIQSGWADIYSAGLPCQYININGVPPGNYVLRMIVNPANLLPESNTNNNVTLVPVTIPPTDCSAAPANDTFSGAISITSSPFTYAQFNNCATKELGEPAHAGNSGGHSVWFKWTPTSNQTAVVTTKRSDFDTLLAVYTGSSVSALSLVASNDDVIDNVVSQSQVSFAAVAGTTYHIAVDGWNNAVGSVELNLNPAAHDDFANARIITGPSGSNQSYTIGASKERHELAHAFDLGGHSVWYRWTAPTSGPIDFNTSGSSYNTTLAVYTGTQVTNLTLIAANNDDSAEIGSLASRVDFNATAGTTYQIAIDGFGGDAGNFTLNWNMISRLSISEVSNTTVKVQFSGVHNQRYNLLVSTNLSSWSTQTTLTMPGNLQEYFDSSQPSRRFYRTRRVP